MTATYTYDFADRQETLDVQVGAGPVQPVVTSSSYLPSGPLASLALANGLTESRSFDSRYVPTNIGVVGHLDWTYATDGVGNVLTVTDGLDVTQNRSYAYQEVQYFLTQGNGPWGNLSWSYDRIGNRLTETRDGLTDAYAYVQNPGGGNTALLSQVTLGVGGTRDYVFGPAGHLEQVTSGANQITFEIDAEGRLAALDRPSAGARSEFAYDGRSFLRRAAEPEIFADGFESGDLSCWSTVVGGTQTGTCPTPPTTQDEAVQSVYDSEGLLRSRENKGTGVHLLYFAGRPVAQLEVTGTPTLTYLTTDHLGTPVLATDGVGTTLWSGGFEPFGQDWNGASDAGVFLRFPGQWDDPAWQDAALGAGVYYNVHRWYEPGAGRYGRPDPVEGLATIGGEEGFSAYLYGQARALNLIDPLGLYTALGNKRFRAQVDNAIGLIRKGLQKRRDRGEECCTSYFDGFGVDLDTWLSPGGEPFIAEADSSQFAGDTRTCGKPQTAPPFSYVFVNKDCFRKPDPCKLASIILHEVGHLVRKDSGHDNEPEEFFKRCNLGCVEPGRFH